MLKFRWDALGLSPFMAIMVYIWGRTTWASARLGGYLFLASLGISIIVATAILLVLAVFREHPFTRIFLLLFSGFLVGLGVLFALVGEFQGMHILILACWSEGAYFTVLLLDIVKDSRKTSFLNQVRHFKNARLPTHLQGKKGHILILDFILLGLTGILFAQAYRFDSNDSLEFKVSRSDLENTELVLYWVRTSMEDPATFVDILAETNTTLALQGNPDLFEGIGEHANSSIDAANLVRLCNQAGVKVEVWPVPSASNPCALSLRHVDCMPGVYQKFKDWVTRNNITVDYYAFDIEDYVPIDDFDTSLIGRLVDESSPGYWFLRGIHDICSKQAFLRENRSDWDLLVSKQQQLVDQIIADGFVPRATIQPVAWDALDGDFNEFKKDFMQSYEITGYQYLSSMYYRSCEWGNNDSTYKVYRNVQVLDAVSPYPMTAICIGCIHYAAYQEVGDVANDVWLSVANGADSVRIFLGDSWVYSAANESAGLQNLRTMLETCRQGGTARTEYKAEWDVSLLSTILVDVISDL